MTESATPAENPSSPTYAGFDPSRDVVVDGRSLKGLAHPLRVQLLGLLREHGPATATELARRVGQSSGATSYHVRQLAEYGFVEDAPGRGNARERWWRARHRATYFDPYAVDDTTRAAGEEYLRAVARATAERIMRHVDGMPTYLTTLGDSWRHGSTMSDALLWLTAAESTRLAEELDALLVRYRSGHESPGDGRVRVVVQWQVLPQQPDAASDDASDDASDAASDDVVGAAWGDVVDASDGEAGTSPAPRPADPS